MTTYEAKLSIAQSIANLNLSSKQFRLLTEDAEYQRNLEETGYGTMRERKLAIRRERAARQLEHAERMGGFIEQRA